LKNNNFYTALYYTVIIVLNRS